MFGPALQPEKFTTGTNTETNVAPLDFCKIDVHFSNAIVFRGNMPKRELSKYLSTIFMVLVIFPILIRCSLVWKKIRHLHVSSLSLAISVCDSKRRYIFSSCERKIVKSAKVEPFSGKWIASQVDF